MDSAAPLLRELREQAPGADRLDGRVEALHGLLDDPPAQPSHRGCRFYEEGTAVSEIQSAEQRFGPPPGGFLALQVWRYRKLRFLGFGRRKALRCVKRMVSGR
jgi:hypothetical protein